MSLLAIDLGVRVGLAMFGDDGRLCWYRSRNYGSASRLRRAAWGLVRPELEGDAPLTHIIAEGDRNLGEAFKRLAERFGLRYRLVSAEQWRDDLLLPREQRSGKIAKQHADERARQVIEDSGAPRPTSLRHDAAEAILIGHWAVETGWFTARG